MCYQRSDALSISRKNARQDLDKITECTSSRIVYKDEQQITLHYQRGRVKRLILQLLKVLSELSVISRIPDSSLFFVVFISLAINNYFFPLPRENRNTALLMGNCILLTANIFTRTKRVCMHVNIQKHLAQRSMLPKQLDILRTFPLTRSPFAYLFILCNFH